MDVGRSLELSKIEGAAVEEESAVAVEAMVAMERGRSIVDMRVTWRLVIDDVRRFLGDGRKY